VRAFGVAHEFNGFNEVAERSAFLVDGEGIIRRVWRYAWDEVPDVDELLEAARTITSS